jgi:AraC-like DNA-binding protein
MRHTPFDGMGRPRLITLPVELIHPVVRLAHCVRGALSIAERIIFDHEFVLILAGSGELRLGRESVPFAAHDLLFIPPFTAHSFLPTDRTAGEHIAVHFDFAPRVPALAELPDHRRPYAVRLAHGLQIPTVLSLAPGHRIVRALHDLLRAWPSDDPLARLAVAHALSTVLLAVLRDRSHAAADRESPSTLLNRARVERAIAFMERNLTRRLTVADMAEVAGVSPSRFTTICAEVTGYSPLQYLRHTRVEAARRLLGDLTLSIKEVAARTGFDDSYHFSRVFRQVDGLSPSEYRAALITTQRS